MFITLCIFIPGRSTKTKDPGGLLTWRPSLLNLVGGRDRSDSGESGASAASVNTLTTEVKSLGWGPGAGAGRRPDLGWGAGPGAGRRPDLSSELEIEIWVRREQGAGAEVPVLRRATR